MNAELEKIVDSVLANGELTDRSRELLMKKAEQLGVDLLDFELELESKIAQKKASTSGPLPVYTSNTPKSNKEGDLKKCPSCGAPIQSFATKCSDCGHEFRNIQASGSVQKLFEMLNELSEKRKESNQSILGGIGKFYGENLFKIQDKNDIQKKELISNFPIPNTREDILEFLSLAVPKAKKIGTFWTSKEPEIKTHNDFVPVWQSKCEQLIMKARFSMKDDKKTLDEIEYYAKQLGVK